ncbi:metallophosphoesterase [Gorillibacterium sp. CAU 1737]|uniref:metallophosphoesterase family protein n=1 Tax=Gorillibacterium sp. CAU 1737 TaxID=3140362 RepID=UPI003261082D
MADVRFVVCTDLHADAVPDAKERLRECLDTVRRTSPDFLMVLGDLCHPHPHNQPLLDMIEESGVPCYHAVGNHDSDTCTQDEVLAFLKQSRSYYSFTAGMYKFLVLDACYIKTDEGTEPYGGRNYSTTSGVYPYIPVEQLVWLERELAEWDGHALVFTHHSLVNSFAKRGVANRDDVRALLEKGTRTGRVLLCMNGHDHGDEASVVNGICYYTLNSMTYIWQNVKPLFPYPVEVHEKYPGLANLILYENALHAVVTLTENGEISIQGMESDYRRVTPTDAGITNQKWNDVSIDPVVTSIRVKDGRILPYSIV